MQKIKQLRIYVLILFLLSMVLMIPAEPVLAAGMATDTLTIKVGYQGGPFMTKKVYSWKELDDLYGGSLASHKVTYSYYGGRDGSGGRNVVVSARGFYIKDLMNDAGIDISSIGNFSFYSSDQTGIPWTSMSRRELLDTSRYYYPNMGIDDEYNQIALDGGDMSAGATQVQSMLALEDNWEWEGISSNFNSMSPSGRFHLLFGQEYVSESRTNQAAKYVHTIEVVFSGAPKISTESNIELKVGSDYRVQVNVTAADTELENYIRDNLVWSSNNTEAVEVDQYGQLTVKGDGEATITAKSGDTVGTVVVNFGHGSGTGSSASEAPSTGEGSSGEAAESQAKDSQNQQVSYSENNRGVYILSKDFMQKTKNAEWVNSILQHEVSVDSDTGSVMNSRTEPMDEDAEALVVTEEKKASMLIVLVMAVLCFLFGLSIGAVRYRLARRKEPLRLPECRRTKALLKKLTKGFTTKEKENGKNER